MTNTLTMEQIKAIGDKIMAEWADKGKIIEGGWQVYLAFGLKDAGDIQKKEMRKAYYLGAQHLFASIMSVLDPGSEPSERDLARMDLIHKELEAFKRSIFN